MLHTKYLRFCFYYGKNNQKIILLDKNINNYLVVFAFFIIFAPEIQIF